jgi:hypothetical protein
LLHFEMAGWPASLRHGWCFPFTQASGNKTTHYLFNGGGIAPACACAGGIARR